MTVSTNRMNTQIPENTRTDWNIDPSMITPTTPVPDPENDTSPNPGSCISEPAEKAIKIDPIK